MTVILWKDHHPERHDRAVAGQTVRLAQKFVSGRAGKEALMPRMREVAGQGQCDGWVQALEALEREGADVSSLRIWGTAKDKSEIDRMCTRSRGPQSRLRPSRFVKRPE